MSLNRDAQIGESAIDRPPLRVFEQPDRDRPFVDDVADAVNKILASEGLDGSDQLVVAQRATQYALYLTLGLMVNYGEHETGSLNDQTSRDEVVVRGDLTANPDHGKFYEAMFYAREDIPW